MTRHLQAHERRVLEEHEQISNKLQKLDTFINRSTSFKSLQEVEQGLLKDQYEAMIAYRNILDKRIALFQDPT